MEHDSKKIIDELGGNTAVSKLFCISSQAVSKWRREGIPSSRLMYLKLARPEIFHCKSSVKQQKAA